MITTTMTGGGRVASRLARAARRLGEAHAEALMRERRGDPRRWRLARLLWPLFARDV